LSVSPLGGQLIIGCYAVAIETSVFVSCCSFLIACSGMITNEQQETTCHSRRMSVTAQQQ